MAKWIEYQSLTTIAKRVGGPKGLVTLLIGGGILLGFAAKYGIDRLKKYLSEKTNNVSKYNVVEDYESDDIVVKAGDVISVYKIDDDVALIKINNDETPYCVSLDILKTILK